MVLLQFRSEKGLVHAEGSLIQISLLTLASKMREELVALFSSPLDDSRDWSSFTLPGPGSA